MKNRIISWVALITITLAFIFSIIIVNVRFNDSLESYKNEKIVVFNNEIDAILCDKKSFTNYVFETVVNNDYVLELIDEAYTADTDRQNILRDDLYNYLLDDYQILLNYDYRQLHFQLPDSTSFLRLHRPELFGDSIFDVRYSIRTVNAEHEFIEGFEEGRIYNAYRFVYPLEYENRHIGSVEVSISMAAVIHSLTEVNQGDFNFWMKTSVVEENVFISEQDNYEYSSFSNDFLVDISAFSAIEERNIFTNQELVSFYSALDQNIIDRIENNEEFTETIAYNNTNYEITFIKIYNIEGEHVAYMSSITVDSTGNTLSTSIISSNFLIVAIYIVLVGFFIYILNRNKKLNILLMTDQLTGIYNRGKFETELNRIKTSNPYEEFCVLMIDVDDFKQVNDVYGHSVGDVVLKELANIISSNLNEDGLAARFGGEEFIVLLRNISSNNCDILSEKLRSLVEKHHFSNDINITISIGGYHKTTEFKDIDKIIKMADTAMYKAKSKGKNKVYKIKD